ncbi:MAG TPA: hypothetical protein DDW50_08330 [Firmicutes bacterium]|nr:hypothetical protein [Bacillota bacterium]
MLLRHSKQYLGCETTFNLVKAEYPKVGIATIYRTLSLLEELHWVSAILANNHNKRYQLRLDQKPKYLLICRKC